MSTVAASFLRGARHLQRSLDDLSQTHIVRPEPLRAIESHWWRDIVAGCITVAAYLAYLLVINVLARLCSCRATLTRKLLHIGTGLIMLCCWPLFSRTKFAFVFATIPPLCMAGMFLLVGLGTIKWDAAVRNVSRSGEIRELLLGPFAYAIIIAFITCIFFREIPAVVSMSALCVGDGFSDIVGRRMGKNNPLPWNKKKSWAGTAAFFVTSFVAGMVFGTLMSIYGCWAAPVPWGILALRVGISSAVAGLVESLPIKEWDNLNVAMAAIATDYIVCLIVVACGGSVSIHGTDHGVIGLVDR